MGFFPDDPPPEPHRPAVPPPPTPWLGPPTDEFPERLLVRHLLVQTDRIVIALSHLDVHREGVLFALETTARLSEGDEERRARFGPRANQPRMGLELGDGTAVVLERPPRDSGARPERWSLHQTGGEGYSDADRYRTEFGMWLWPLPPAGTTTFVLDWPEHDVAEVRSPLDGDAILTAASRVRPLWP